MNTKKAVPQRPEQPQGRVLSLSLQYALLTLSMSASVQAQQAGAQAQPTPQAALPEVTVTGERGQETAIGPVKGYVAKRSATATKTDTPILETPQSISVITADEIETRKPKNISEVIQYTAGATSTTRAVDSRYDNLGIRGFAVNPYQDGLKLNSVSAFGPPMGEPYGQERFEVLRGPSSMVYGQVPPGGLVNLVSKRPSEVPLHEIELQFGSNNRTQAALDLGGPVAQDGEWTYRLTGLARKSDTDVDFIEDNRFFIAPALTWSPNAATSLTLLASYTKDDAGNSGGTAAFLPYQGIASVSPLGKIPHHTYGGEPSFDHYKKEQSALGLEFGHRFNDTWSFEQKLRVQRIKLDYQTLYGDAASYDPTVSSELLRSLFARFGHTDTVLSDTHAVAQWSDGMAEHTTLIGLDYSHATTKLTGHDDVAPSTDVYAPVYGQAISLPADPSSRQTDKASQLGFYVQDQIKLQRQWLITLGGRWDHVSSSTTDHLNGDDHSTQSDDKFTGRGALTYLADNGLAPYISWSNSFEQSIGATVDGQPFKPVTAKQTEVGLKYRPPGSSALFTAAAFDIKQQNRPTSALDPSDPYARIQGGEIRSRGFELEAKGRLFRSLDLSAAYTYTDARVTKSNYDFELNTRPHGVPMNAVAVFADYNFRGEGWNGLGIGLGVRYLSEAASDPVYAGPPLPTLPAVTLADLTVHYEKGPYKVALNVNNLFDKETYDVYTNGAWYGPDRQVLATFSYRW